VIQGLKDVNLRGLGGAAFPIGMKWEFTRRAPGAEKYVICHADESEPGTFKDRVLLEQLPHLVVEGMLIGAWVFGARRGIIYLRHEYGDAARALEQTIAEAYAAGALGEAVFGSDFSFDLEVFISPGGYILGEETALLEALADRRGEPRNQPPFPTNVGLYGQPTLINNVETFAAVPAICSRGTDWWAEQGKPGYKGFKYVSVSGDVVRPGVYCVPWGSTAREVLELCGGMAEGRGLKAFSPGGASTPFLPPDRLDTPLDFEAMQNAGSALGTGAMLFVADHRDLLDVVLAQMRFFRNESCGKCVPCRVGSQKAVEMVEQVLAGESASTPIALADLHETLVKTSICGLGQVALLPLVDALRQFPAEPSLLPLQGERT
jgi:formate dehydrogenase